MTDLDIGNDSCGWRIVGNSFGSGWRFLCLQQRLNLLYSPSQSARLGPAFWLFGCSEDTVGYGIEHKHENGESTHSIALPGP